MSSTVRRIRILAASLVLLVLSGGFWPPVQATYTASMPQYGQLALGGSTLWYLNQAGEDGSFTLYALDPVSGKTKHSYRGASGGQIEAVTDTLCIVWTTSDGLVAYSSSATEPQWVYTGPTDFLMYGLDAQTLYGGEGFGASTEFVPPVLALSWNVVAIDLKTGVIRWRTPPDALSGYAVNSGSIGNGLVFVGQVLDARTGEERWTIAKRSQAPVVVWPQADGIVILDEAHESVRALNARTGDDLWRVPVAQQAFAFGGGIVTVADGAVYGVYPFPESFVLNEYARAPTFLLALDAATGTERWRYPQTAGAFMGFSASVGVDAERVYAENNGAVTALDMGTGQAIWVQDTTGYGKIAAVTSSLVLLSSTLSSTEETAAILALGATTGKPIWTYAPDGALRDQLTPSGDSVFVLSGKSNGKRDTLVALNERSGVVTWKRTFETGGLFQTSWIRYVLIGAAFLIVAVVLLHRSRHRRPEARSSAP